MREHAVVIAGGGPTGMVLAGERARAAASYRSVAGLWASADAALQPLVAEARAGLQRTALQRTALQRTARSRD